MTDSVALRSKGQAVVWGDGWMHRALEAEMKLRTAEARIKLLETIVDNLAWIDAELAKIEARQPACLVD